MKQSITSLQKSRVIGWEDPNFPGPATSSSPGPTLHFSSDLIESQNNPDWKERTSKAQPVGGDFYVVKRDYSEYNSLGGDRPVDFSRSADPNQPNDKHVRTWMTIRQQLWDITNDDFPPSPASSKAQLAAFGRKAIAAVNPTNSSFDGSVFLGELREGLPRAVGLATTGRERSNLARRAGSEYLNVEFGWKPLLSDINSFLYTANNSEKIWQQYKRNAGKLVKRRYSSPEERSTSVQYLGFDPRPTLMTGMYSGSPDSWGYTTLTIEQTRKRWFEGVFKYYLPENPIGRKLSEWNKLWGIVPDPAMVWELTPWSWAADWVGDAGTLMKNLSAFATDSLVMPWAYVMEEASTTYTYELKGRNIYTSHLGEFTMRQTLKTTSKRRIRASPYGFLLSWDDFTPRQIAIATSIGLTR